MPTQTMYERILDLIQAESIDTLFGIPDPSFFGMFIEAERRGMRIISPHHEQAAALTADGLYCVSDDGYWGARVRLGPGTPEVGDVVMIDEPSLVVNGSLTDADDRAPGRGALPVDGLMLRFQGGLGWLLSVPDAEQWHAALTQAIRAAR